MWTVRLLNVIHIPNTHLLSGKMLVILRDGRKLHGVLRSYDQFGEHPILR